MYLKSMLTLVVSVCLMGASFANSEVPYPASYQPLTSEDVAMAMPSCCSKSAIL